MVSQPFLYGLSVVTVTQQASEMTVSRTLRGLMKLSSKFTLDFPGLREAISLRILCIPTPNTAGHLTGFVQKVFLQIDY